MAKVLRQIQTDRLYLFVLIALVSGCAVPPAKITLVDPKTEKTAVCPDGLFESRMMTREQAAQQRAWHTEFQRTHNRLPTPMEGCLSLYEILGFVRAYTNPAYGWTISYPSSWTVDSGDLGFVKISSSANQALCGIHSREVPFRTVDEFTDALERAPNRVMIARRKISLPNDIIGNDVLAGIVGGGMSRRIYVLSNGRGFGIDCETYERNWDRVEPLYDRTIKSFTLAK